MCADFHVVIDDGIIENKITIMENLSTNGYSGGSYSGSMNGSINSQGGEINNASPNTPEEPSSTVDHALLESLFYNEMMQLEASSLLSPNFLSQHLSEAVASTPPPPRRRINHSVSTDANTIAEKALLRDFGVTASPVMHGGSGVAPPPLIEAGTATSATPQSSTTPWGTENHHPQPETSMNVDIPPQPHPYHHGSMQFSRAPTVQYMDSRAGPATAIQNMVPPPPPPSMQVAAMAPGIYPPPGHVAGASGSHHLAPSSLPAPQQGPQVLQERPNNQLVSQFTTLASRLGIDLPSSVLQSLTAAAAANFSKGQARTGAGATVNKAPPPVRAEQTLGGRDSPSVVPMESRSLPQTEMHSENGHTAAATGSDDIVQELRRTAEDAIAAVSENRKRVLEDHPAGASSTSDGAGGIGSSSARPMYSKRRKKPRLSDCETKLAELQAENELLKRHLANVSNKAYRFEQEKTQAGARFKKMLDGECAPEQLEKAVQEFTDLYSDYGRRRQQELSFHLEQLQRLANPTNFTKMGLWTIAQTSADPKRNPIAGILQRELEITPQQGRKIIDQREKIRTLCDNLKECLALLVKLKGLCEQKTRLFHDRMTKCREILTSKQTVKLIIWINDNTQLLEAVCPGWGTEHIQSKAPSSKLS